MPRGASLVPQQRHPTESSIPEELKLSIFESPVMRYPVSLLDSNKGGNNSFNSVRQGAPQLPQVPIFDKRGKMTTKQIGVHDFHLRKQATFYWLRSHSWLSLISLSMLLYVGVLTGISVVYLIWSLSCGAHGDTNFVGAFYFTVVSLAANGGYMGESELMTDPTGVCYYGRTALVMMCSYANIIFVGLIAALVVSKAESSSKLASRVVFSRYCTLTAVPGHVDVWRLSFRLANLDNQQPLAHGRLRLFVVSTEPLKSYRLAKRARQQRLGKQQHWVSSRSAGPLTADTLQEQLCTEASFGDVVDNPELLAFMQHRLSQQRVMEALRRRQHGKGKKSRRAKREAENQQLQSSTSRRTTPCLPEVSRKTTPLQSTVNPASRNRHQRSSRRRAVLRPTTPSGTTPLVSTDTADNREPSSASTSTSSSVMSNCSVRTNVSLASLRSPIPQDSPQASVTAADCPLAAAPSTGLLAKQTAPASYHSIQVITGDTEHNPDDEDDTSMQRVHINTSELRWVCAEESYLASTAGDLSLWYPATITHIIDERSPLYRFLVPAAASLPTERPTSRSRFQIIAAYDAIEMESGAPIMAKNTYMAADIVTHHKFSTKLVYMKPYSSEVLLDYHYFNQVLPVTAVESSTTDSNR